MADTLLPTVIKENPFPELVQTTNQQSTTGGSGDTLSSPTTVERSFPTQTIARTVISDSLNTQERRILSDYSFGESGAIAIGNYAQGVSGDIKLSPAGIVARNKTGATTFTLDATTGDATFKGTIAANSLIAGMTDIGTGGTVFIDGANNRIIVSDGTNDRVLIGKF